jgi:mannitol/fructose-specific phosphotransferase system IIA component (Ntr-type)
MQIDLANYLDSTVALTNIKGKNKKTILTCLIDHLITSGKIQKQDRREILKVLVQREEMGSTAIGGNIALPHARVTCVKDIMLCIGITSDGLDFESLDDEPVNIVVLLLSNQKEAGLHLKMLALLARVLRDKYFVQKIKALTNPEDIIACFKKQQALVR